MGGEGGEGARERPGGEEEQIPDAWDDEACIAWLTARMQDGIHNLMKAHDGMTSRVCDACHQIRFFPPGSPTECQYGHPNSSHRTPQDGV